MQSRALSRGRMTALAAAQGPQCRWPKAAVATTQKPRMSHVITSAPCMLGRRTSTQGNVLLYTSSRSSAVLTEACMHQGMQVRAGIKHGTSQCKGGGGGRAAHCSRPLAVAAELQVVAGQLGSLPCVHAGPPARTTHRVEAAAARDRLIGPP